MRDFPSNDDWKISPLKQRTVKELAKKAAKHNIIYLRFQGQYIYLFYVPMHGYLPRQVKMLISQDDGLAV